MLTIHVWPKRLKEFLLTHPLYKSPRPDALGALARSAGHMVQYFHRKGPGWTSGRSWTMKGKMVLFLLGEMVALHAKETSG